MGISLRPGVTCCQSGGFTFFLDVDRDRYFALGGGASEGFENIVEGRPLGDDELSLARRLTQDRLLSQTPGLQRPGFCAERTTIDRSAIDRIDELPAKPPYLAALARTTMARWSLRYAGLARTLDRISKRKRTRQTQHGSVDTIIRVAAAFERCKAVANALDQCLPRSIAVAHALIDHGVSPTLLIGVQAQPFSAHAWVECGDLIVNDRFDRIHAFKPILIL